MQHDHAILLASEPAAVGAEGEGRVLELVEEGAAGQVVDRDPGSIHPGHGDSTPVAVDGQPGRLAGPRVIGGRVVRMPCGSVNTTP